VKTALVLLGALTVTAAIYVLMDRMISRDRTRLLNTYDAQPIEFARTPLEEQTRTKDRRKKPPPKPKEIKRVRSEVDASLNRMASLPQDFTAYNVTSLLGEGAGVALGQNLLEGSGESMAMVMASDLTPLTMLPPQYPPSALMRGTEGWVQVSFLVTEEGFVEDPVVIDAKPRSTFDDAAMAAALRWRFRPVVQGGQPVAVRAYMQIDFTLPDSR
jgi:protein TonB